MCRLIGYAAPARTTLAKQIGTEQVLTFRDLSCLHEDGWGSAWLGAHGEVRSYRTTLPPFEDAQFEPILDAEPSTARLVHLRWATARLAVTQENTHPFVADGLALAHNGSITPRSGLEELLQPQTWASLRGFTDSERYLALIRQELCARTVGPDGVSGGGAQLVQAVCDVVTKLRRRFPVASLNALILSRSTFIAVHASSVSVLPVEDMIASGLGADDLPTDHRDNYFLMRRRTGPGGSIIFSSTGLDSGDWRPLAPESVTAVDLATMRVQVHELVAGSTA